MNWLVSSFAGDRHPHELLHQAPAEPVHEAGVWYPVSDSLFKSGYLFIQQGVLLALGSLLTLIEEIALMLAVSPLQQPAG